MKSSAFCMILVVLPFLLGIEQAAIAAPCTVCTMDQEFGLQCHQSYVLSCEDPPQVPSKPERHPRAPKKDRQGSAESSGTSPRPSSGPSPDPASQSLDERPGVWFDLSYYELQQFFERRREQEPWLYPNVKSTQNPFWDDFQKDLERSSDILRDRAGDITDNQRVLSAIDTNFAQIDAKIAANTAVALAIAAQQQALTIKKAALDREIEKLASEYNASYVHTSPMTAQCELPADAGGFPSP